MPLWWINTSILLSLAPEVTHLRTGSNYLMYTQSCVSGSAFRQEYAES